MLNFLHLFFPEWTLFLALMPLDEREDAIQELEEIRDTRVIAYVTGDRPSGGPALQQTLGVEPTVVPVIYKAMRSLGESENIDLFLYTRGGAVDVVWPIVSIIREHATENFRVLVPFRCHSVGTLVALGADEIVMCEAAELTGVDPTNGNAFNPLDELEEGQRKGISVEDYSACFDFARDADLVGLTDPAHILEVFRGLIAQLPPRPLGHVQRIHTEIRELAKRLLLSGREDVYEEWVEEVVTTLTEELYSHTHALSRQDAKRFLGDMVVFPNDQEHQAIWGLLTTYVDDLSLNEPHNLLTDLNGSQREELTYTRGVVETGSYSSVYQTDVTVTATSKSIDGWLLGQKAQQEVANREAERAALPLHVPGLPPVFNREVTFQGWRENKDEV